MYNRALFFSSNKYFNFSKTTTMKAINFNTTVKEDGIISLIVKRAVNLKLIEGDILSLQMDLSATHCNGTSIDFDKLLAFDDYNFAHDIFGIMDSIDRNTGKLTNCFLPRSTKH